MSNVKVLVFYGGDAATDHRNELLAWLRGPTFDPQLDVRIVADAPPNSDGAVDDRVADAISWADLAIALVTPDPRSTSGAPNVIDEIGRWRAERTRQHALCVVRQQGVLPYSNLGGIVWLEFRDRVRECFDMVRQFVGTASPLVDWDLRGFLGMSSGGAGIKVGGFQATGRNVSGKQITSLDVRVTSRVNEREFTCWIRKQHRCFHLDRLLSIAPGAAFSLSAPFDPDFNGHYIKSEACPTVDDYRQNIGALVFRVTINAVRVEHYTLSLKDGLRIIKAFESTLADSDPGVVVDDS